MSIKIQKIHPEAVIPTKANKTDAGYDLYSVGTYTFKPGEQHLVSTGIAIALPAGHWGEIKDRSGRANDGWRVGGGVIDEGYRGEGKVVLQNMSNNEMVLTPGSKIAQFVVQRYLDTEIEVVESLDKTDRGAKGFGSSGDK